VTPQLIARVDAWLAARYPVSSSEPPALVRCWSDLLNTLLRQREHDWNDDAEATESAMRGILLALVREAWGDSGAYTYRIASGQWYCAVASIQRGDSTQPGWRLRDTADGRRWVGQFLRDTEDDALVAALEAAPQP
jgi:hypothetical protein